MTECQACGSEDVAWREGKNGKFYLTDTKRPHFCPKRAKKGSQNGQKPAKVAKSAKDSPAPDPMVAEVVAGLVAQGIKQIDAARYVAAAGEAVDVEALLRAALAQKNAEMVAREQG